MCMRVLDIDLDFFLDVITHAADPGERRPSGPDDRPHSEGDIPWTEKEVIRFLEKHCGLSDQEPINGRLVTHHMKPSIIGENSSRNASSQRRSKSCM